MCQARLAKMHLIIDHTRQQVFAAAVDHTGTFRRSDTTVDPGDPVAFNENIDISDLAFIDESHVANQEFAHACIMRVCGDDYHRNKNGCEPDFCGTRRGMR